MPLKLIKFGLLIAVFAGLAGCAPKAQKPMKTPLAQTHRGSSELAWLMRIQPDNPTERLVLTPATYRNGVYVCALENLSKPCLPKLSALVADKLEQKGIVVVADQSKAVATLYFETWFDSFSNHANVEIEDSKGMLNNPTVMGKDFAAKIELSLATGNLPEVHKHFREAPDPFSAVAANANDEQKFIYVALTAVAMEDAVDYPGEGENHLGASANPWPRPPAGKRTWQKVILTPPKRTLIGNYNGEIPTEKAVIPMLKDGIGLLLERAGQSRKKSKL